MRAGTQKRWTYAIVGTAVVLSLIVFVGPWGMRQLLGPTVVPATDAAMIKTLTDVFAESGLRVDSVSVVTWPRGGPKEMVVVLHLDPGVRPELISNLYSREETKNAFQLRFDSAFDDGILPAELRQLDWANGQKGDIFVGGFGTRQVFFDRDARRAVAWMLLKE